MSHKLYLGRDAGEDAPYRLEPEALRTHGVVLGMTGSGKTGMSLVMLEELVRSGVPILAIDPKGDLGNLGLLFPDLSPEAFAPWAGDEAAEASAAWRGGLARWGLGAPDVADLAECMELTLFTPGSDAGVSVDVFGTLRRPAPEVVADDEARRLLVQDVVSGLLGLVGEKADPRRSPSHIVLSAVLDSAWVRGEDPDLEALIGHLVDPPFEKVGVFPVDRFFPPDDRMDLAMSLNGVLAAPGFDVWRRGVALDIDALLAPGPKTQVSVFCIAHLSEAERSFFLALLLGRVLSWTRRQPGTQALRAVLFFDEVAGYLPPHPHDPPTKRPLLTLMKQARAMGLGVLLSTQNPVDLDYKAISNAGLWCIGRLRTAQDRKRVLAGLPGDGWDDAVAGLDKRAFLVARSSGDARVVESRHALCYLRGPLTRVEITQLRGELEQAPVSASTGVSMPPPVPSAAVPAAAPAPARATAPPLEVSQWVLDPRVVFGARLGESFVPFAEPARDDGIIQLRPAVYAELALRFDEDRLGFVLDTVAHRVWFPLGGRLPDVPLALRIEPSDLLDHVPDGVRYAELPTWMDEPRELATLKKQVIQHVYRSETTGMWANKSLKLYGRAEETAEDFLARCQAAARDVYDTKAAKLQLSFDKKLRRLEDRIRKKEVRLLELRQTAKARQTDELLNAGETMLSWFTGRRRSLSSAASKRRMTATADAKVAQAELDIDQLGEEMDALRIELEDALQQLEDDAEARVGATEAREVRLEKNDIQVRAFGVLWVPVTRRI